MSLATSCTSCSTVFRVVQDQLKVSEGWVRCGKCGEVFSALEGLFDLERDGRPSRPAPAQVPAPAAEQEGLPRSRADAAYAAFIKHEPEPAPAAVAHHEPEVSMPLPAWAEAPAPTPAASRDRPDFADARFDSEFETELAPALQHESAPDTAQPAEPAEAGSEFVESMLADESAPAFVRHADRRARWLDPRLRVALAAASIALVLLLAMQLVHQRRDLIAATWPALRGPLFGWCSLVGCSIEPLRRIEDISVEATALTRSPAPDAFALSVTLRNRSDVGLATPWVELTLKEGELPFARRMLAPDDFRTPLAVLPAGAESTLQLLLTAGNPRVNGYSVEIFYP
ncbi:MAG: zinc-ribbon and DUF3426 domain-containing protein [Burkholderiaceae bacterium]